jgi:drug/metabolite transporter (DMT)-like permease
LFAYIGELAGLATSVCWSFGSVFFTLSGRQVGSPVVNRTRLLIALVLVSLTHWATEGQLWPLGAAPSRWGWMALSGIIGFVIGDALLLQAFVMIGPRLSMLLMALAPVMSVIMAWVLLGETLNGLQLLAIGLAVSGVAWVVTDRRNGANGQPDHITPRDYLIGLLLALGGAFGQAAGLIASRKGLEGDFSALSGNLMRLIAASLVIWLLTVMNGQARANFRALYEKPRAMRLILGGSIAGPFIGVWLSLIAVQKAPVGIASTLMSFAPIILLPVGRVLFHERITWRAVVGTILAMIGTAILFLQA